MRSAVAEHWEYFWPVWALIVPIVALVALIFVAAYYESEEWVAFKSAHNCKIVAHIKGDVFNTIGFGAKGEMVVGIGSTPDKKGWLCDDGQTYYR